MDVIDSTGQRDSKTISTSPGCLRVGSRKSELALTQTRTVIDRLKEFYLNNPDKLKSIQEKHSVKWNNEFEIKSMSTTGDKILDKPLPAIGTKSLFTRELEIALLENEISFVVHSLKDLPTTLPRGCCIGAVLKRDNPNDVIVLKKSLRDKLKPVDLLFGMGMGKLKIGTSSQRRIAMVKSCNQQIECIDIRGNLNTRISKLDKDEGEYAAIILARAGLDRMGWSERASGLLTPQEDPRLKDWYHAVGQGALAVECRSDDEFIIDLLRPIMDSDTTYEVIAERSLMKELQGGCSVPLGVRSTLSRHGLTTSLKLESIVLSLDARETVSESIEGIINAGIHDTATSQQDDFEDITTGISLGKHCQASAETAHAMLECAKLGICLANRMIDRGCLRLMNRDSGTL